jgi:hypothetical protein
MENTTDALKKKIENHSIGKCEVCQCNRELTTCNYCMNQMLVTMTHRIFDEIPNDTNNNRRYKEILNEIEELKRLLVDLKIKGISEKLAKNTRPRDDIIL